MMYVHFEHETGVSVGLLNDGVIRELDVPNTVRNQLRAVHAVQQRCDATTGRKFSPKDVSLLAPVLRPGKIVCVGLNYREHADEGGYEIPDEPMLFGKSPNAVVGPEQPVYYPSSVTQLDYEGELGVVVGKSGRHIGAEDADEYIAGFTVFNDISARDVQYAFSQFFRGKSFDTFAPTGPGITPPDAVDVDDLDIVTSVNGETRQNSNTEDMIFSVADLVASISETMTLDPGDIIATGTPPGVGVHQDPPRLLDPGDTVTVEIPGLGSLTSTITTE